MAENAAAAAALEETGEGCRTPEPRAVTPWLVKRCYVHEGFEITKTNYDFCNIHNSINERCREFIPALELTSTTFFQKPSHQGWLIIVCDEEDYDYTQSGRNYRDCFLWNPITKETIQLPSLMEFYNGNSLFGFSDCVLSSPPLTDNDSDDSMVLLFCFNHNERHVNHDEEDDDEDEEHDYAFLFCRPGEKHWRVHEFSPDIIDLIISPRRPESVLCFKGKLYLMCTDDINLDDQLDHHLEIEKITKGADLTLSTKSFTVKKVMVPLVGRTYCTSHYVESPDYIFRVDMIHVRGGEVISIEVVRLNFSLMEWEKVNSLEDHVLFFGNHTTGYSSAANLGFTSGRLYYCLDKGLHKIEIQSTGNTVSLLSKDFYCTDWAVMPVKEQEHMLGCKDGENDFSMARKTETTNTMGVNDKSEGAHCNTKEVEVASYRNNLHEDMVRLIASHLHGLDYKHFRSVCKANRAIIPKVQTTSFLSPWLVFSRDHNDNVFSIVNPMYNDENYSINLFDLQDYAICFHKGGWLLITREHDILLYNPFTRETMKLPDMDKDYCYSVISFSSLPTSSDCIVFAMNEMKDQISIDYIKRGEAQWSSRIFNNTRTFSSMPFLDNAFFYDGCFFCVDYNGVVGVFSVKDNSWKIILQPNKPSYGGSTGYLVECGGDLLLVALEYCWDPIRIFRLNFSNMQWVKVESLGEHVLFISHTSCISAVSPDNNMKNKIYFPRLHWNDGRAVFYSLETQRYHFLGSQNSATNLSDTEGWFRNCTWIQPNMLKCTSQELDWLKTPS